jgi:hypothetical protein
MLPELLTTHISPSEEQETWTAAPAKQRKNIPFVKKSNNKRKGERGKTLTVQLGPVLTFVSGVEDVLIRVDASNVRGRAARNGVGVTSHGGPGNLSFS